jgi:hypothetical protein
MPERGYAASSIQADIKARLRLLMVLTTFLVTTLVAIILVYMYEPVNVLLDFLPDVSVTIIILIVLVLTAVVFYLSRVLTKRVLSSIGLYSGRLDRILGFTREIKEEIYIDRLLEKAMEFSLSLTGSEAGCILLFEGEELVFRVAKGEGIGGLAGRSVAGDTGIAAWVVEHGTPLYLEDVGISEGFGSSLTAVSDYHVRSALCVPLKTEKGMMGAIELVNKKEGLFDDRDVELVAYLADQAAISIERAEFFEDQKNYEVHVTDMLIDLIDHSLPGELHPLRSGHSRRVAQYAGVMAKALGMLENEQRRLYFASLLHDVGYLRALTGGPSGEEMARLHPFWGHEMLNTINFYRDIAPFVLHHHERFDGTGLPEGLAGADIPLASRIIAVAEAFDAALGTSGEEGGREAFQSAAGELRERAGSELDPSLVELFIEAAEGMFE